MVNRISGIFAIFSVIGPENRCFTGVLGRIFLQFPSQRAENTPDQRYGRVRDTPDREILPVRRYGGFEIRWVDDGPRQRARSLGDLNDDRFGCGRVSGVDVTRHAALLFA